jgi:hypothetical protein
MTRPRFAGHALPDFIIIGAQKSATTSLLHYVGQHPRVKLGRKKATHYFDLNYSRGLDWYARHFPRVSSLRQRLWAQPSKVDRQWITGESCPSYIFFEEIPARVKNLLPEAKFVVILRDPVERLISQYRHERRKNRGGRTFEAYVALSFGNSWPPRGEIELIRQNCAIPRGFYEDQLRHWFSYFSRDQFCLLQFENLVKDANAVLSRLFRFLELPDYTVDTSEILNQGMLGSQVEIEPALLEKLRSLYRKKNAGLPDLIGAEFSW